MTEWQPISTFTGGYAFFLYKDGCMCAERYEANAWSDWDEWEKPLFWFPVPPLPFVPDEWRTTKARRERGVTTPPSSSTKAQR